MSDWMPATEAEAAMRDALRAGDQELYFRILARTELLLPVSADALAGRTPMGWGTWTTNGRTHVLAFTSSEALQACLAEHAGSARRLPYHQLAGSWPNLEWWLAVNPGLPIEGYLPSWFVSQLARGDVRLPGRSMGSRARLDHPEPASRARATAAVPRRTAPAISAAAPASAAPEGSAGAASSPAAPEASTAPAPAAPAPTPPGPSRAGSVRQPARAIPSAPAPVAATPAHAEAAASPAPPLPRRISSTHPTPPAPPSSPLSLPERPGERGPRAMPEAGSPAPATETSLGLAPRPVPEPSSPASPTLEGEPAPAPINGGGPAESRTSASPTSVSATSVSATSLSPASVSPTPSRSNGAFAAEFDASAFAPANAVEESLLMAAGGGSTDSFLSTLLLAKVLVPVPAGGSRSVRPGDRDFSWHTETIDGESYVVVFTSRPRLAEHVAASRNPRDAVDAVPVKFVHLIRAWPDESWSFAVNPGTPVGATLPGAQIVALASWAAEVGLGNDADDVSVEEEPVEPVPAAPSQSRVSEPKRPPMMQKAIAPTQVTYYLDRGYDRVSGFVHRAEEVAHLVTPAKLFAALGLGYPNSPFSPDASEVFVLRWPAYQPSLYRIPYGGQTEAAMRAMEGWVIERPPFRGNGFAPGDSSDVIVEFKVDSVRLPHGAQLWRVTAGGEELVAILDADGPIWRRVGEQ